MSENTTPQTPENTEPFVPKSPTTEQVPAVALPSQSIEEQQKSTNTFAILGILFAVLFPPIGIILSIVGVTQTKDHKQQGRGLAIAGIVIGSVLSFFWVIGFILSALFNLFAVSQITKVASTVPTSTSSAYGTNTVKKVVTGPVGSPITIDTMEVKVVKVERNYTPNDPYYKTQSGKEFVLIDVELKNSGYDQVYYGAYNFTLRDSRGVTLYPTYNAGILPRELAGNYIGTGAIATGTVAFEVSSGERNLTLIYTPDYMSSRVAEVLF